MQLSSFQDGLAAALQGPGPGTAPPPAWLQALEAQAGFAVYRNTVLKSCVDALQASYPTVCQLVGEDWFRAAAAVYARAQPPDDGLLVSYGRSFAAFLADFGPAAGLPYLSDVARLDRCWTEAHLAADAPALDHGAWSRQPTDTWARTPLRPHPAARWRWCAEHPAYALWQCHRAGQPVDAALAWTGDGALLTRPGAAVAWRGMPRGGCVVLDACAAGLPLEDAATQALMADPALDFPHLLGSLLDAGALALPHSTPPAAPTP